MTGGFEGWCAVVRLNGGSVDLMPIVLWHKSETGALEGMVSLPGEPGLVPARLAGHFITYLWSEDESGLRGLVEKSQGEGS